MPGVFTSSGIFLPFCCHPGRFLYGVCCCLPSSPKILRPVWFGTLLLRAKTAKDGFPTTTLGNDGFISLFVIPEGFGKYILPSSSPRNLVGDLSFRKGTTTTNNRFPNPAGGHSFGNDNNNNAGGRSFGNDGQQENASQFNNNF